MAQDFDFKAFNSACNGAGSGLKLHLAIGLLKDVEYVMFKYENTLLTDLSAAINDLKAVQVAGKEQAAQRAKDRA